MILLFTCVKMAESMILKLKGKSRRMGSKVTFVVGRQGLKNHSSRVFMAIYSRYCVARAQ